MRTVLAVASGLVMAGAGLTNAGAAERSFDVGQFTELEAQGRFEVRVEVGPEASLRLVGDPDDIADIVVDQDGGELEIEQDRNWRDNRRLDVVAYVTAPSLRRIAASQGAELQVTGVASELLTVNTAMGAIVHVSGQCEALRADTSMGAVLDADELVCASVDASASMGAVARINATDRFDGSSSMGAAIHVVSAPAQRKVSRAMGGGIWFERGN